VFAQGTGDIVGRVSDAGGGVLPGTNVIATNLATNIPRTTVTSDTGDYTTAKMRTGDFSELNAPIFDPTTSPRVAIPGNIIPANRLDPMALKLMSLYPTPNKAGLANNFAYNGEGWQTNQTSDIRIDHRFSEKDSIFARYSYNVTNGVTPSQCPAARIGDRTIDRSLSAAYSGRTSKRAP